jgi:hypothetical protein
MSPRADGLRSRRAIFSIAVNLRSASRVDSSAGSQFPCTSSATGQLSPLNPKEIPMKKLLACLMLGFFVLGSSAGFAQVPEKCKNLTGDAQKKCIDDAKKG